MVSFMAVFMVVFLRQPGVQCPADSLCLSSPGDRRKARINGPCIILQTAGYLAVSAGPRTARRSVGRDDLGAPVELSPRGVADRDAPPRAAHGPARSNPRRAQRAVVRCNRGVAAVAVENPGHGVCVHGAWSSCRRGVQCPADKPRLTPDEYRRNTFRRLFVAPLDIRRFQRRHRSRARKVLGHQRGHGVRVLADLPLRGVVLA